MPGAITPRRHSLRLIVAGVAIVAVLAGALWLWAEYGTAVFFEMIRAGFVACFG